MNDKEYNILIVDDNKDVRLGLFLFIKRITPKAIIDEAENGQIALDMLNKMHYDIVFMDISMPVLNGVSATKIIRKKYPKVKVVILSMHMDNQDISEILACGGHGYILKEKATMEIRGAIKAIMRGVRYLSPEIKALMRRHSIQFD